jgi:hypothetical protein
MDGMEGGGGSMADFMMTMALSKASLAVAFAGPSFVLFAYIAIVLDRRRDNSPSKDDTQVGVKLAIFGLALTGLGLATMGVTGLLSYILGGFKGGAQPIKSALPPILVGGGVVVALITAFLPRTNNATARQPERMMLGLVTIVFGSLAIVMAYMFLDGLFNSKAWMITSMSLAGLLVDGAVAFLALNRLGGSSGWSAPVKPMMPMNPPGYPQQGGGYPPQQGGGYPPQGGGYPPQGGGYPPPGGGYPPQQGGGGYPPR